MGSLKDSTIRVDSEAYMRIVALKPAVNLSLDLVLGKKYQIINMMTGTYMKRRLYAVLGDYSYWSK